MQEASGSSKFSEKQSEIQKEKEIGSKDEDLDSEELEEEGEIGESQSSIRRSTRGRKSLKEKLEKETYREKLLGSRPTVEKMLAKSHKPSKIQSQGPKGAPSTHKRK